MNREIFKKGDTVKCIAARDTRHLTLGKTYLVIKDEEEGIFADRPFVTIEGNEGSLSCHASRFEPFGENQ